MFVIFCKCTFILLSNFSWKLGRKTPCQYNGKHFFYQEVPLCRGTVPKVYNLINRMIYKSLMTSVFNTYLYLCV